MAIDGTVVVTIDDEAIRRLCMARGGTVQQANLRLANRIRNNAHNRCPVDTGHLQSRIQVEEAPEEGTYRVIDDAEYAIYVHEGTSRMAARPFLRDAMREEVARV